MLRPAVSAVRECIWLKERNFVKSVFFTNGSLGEAIMTDQQRPRSDDADTSWIWIGGGLAAIFLVLGMFAILWGGNAPIASTNMSPVAERPITPRTLDKPVTQEPAPSTTGQRAQ
jgi:hypothetical protein